MLKRKILEKLIAWKHRSKRKSLIIYGQRQIGKTYIIRNAFSQEYESYIEFNFVRDESARQIFEGNLDVDTLLINMSFEKPGSKFIPGKTLIFLDEIQECPRAIESLKFWTLDERFDVIAAGSALGMNYKEAAQVISYPVGYVNTMQMYSLDYEEFLWAMGLEPALIETVRTYFDNMKAVPDAVDGKMWEYLRLYMVLGGMPEVITTYLETHNIAEVHEVQQGLLKDYQNHIAIYASADNKIKAKKCYDSIPFQLGKENHKFQYSVVESKSTAAKFRSSIDWLTEQLLVMKIIGLKRIMFPFETYSDETNFRLYPTDIGMLVGMYDISLKKALLNDKALENDAPGLILGTAKGGLYEALAADILYKNGYSNLYFYKHEKNTREIEFLIIKNDSICPIEVKAGRKKANSLAKILEEDETIKVGYKMSSKNIGKVNNLVTLPLYMLIFL